VSLEEEKEIELCARWLSCFIGKDYLYTLFHKPSSPNVIIVEASHELTDKKMRAILGEHHWDKVFVNFEDEGVTSSKVFYSTFQSRREVEKTGWKPVEIKDSYFKNFNPAKRAKIEYPYPATSYCEPPLLAGEVSALNLFRWLPAEIFPEAARAKPTNPMDDTPAPPPLRVVPGSAGAMGMAPSGNNNSGGKGNKKGKGKGKGNASTLDPTIRPTAPLMRAPESSAKAKAIHRQPAAVNAAMYEDNSDDDAAAYIAGDPSQRPANWDGEFNDLSIKDSEPVDAKEDEDDESSAKHTITPLLDIKGKEPDGPLCPNHNKRCKSGICEWAGEQKRLQKRIANKNKAETGQWQRRW